MSEQTLSYDVVLERVLSVADVAYSPFQPAGIQSGEFGDDLLAKFISAQLCEGLDSDDIPSMFNCAWQLMTDVKDQLMNVVEALCRADSDAETMELANIADQSYQNGELKISVKDMPNRGDGLAEYISHTVFECKEKMLILKELRRGCVALGRVSNALSPIWV